MMTLARTYLWGSVIEGTPEYGDGGLDFKPRHATVREVVEALRECIEVSCVPLCKTGHNCWATTETDYDVFEADGEWISYSYHIGGITPHQRRRLFKLAGLVT